jgi:hypothetical protein
MSAIHPEPTSARVPSVMCGRPRRSKGDLVCAPRSGAVMCPAYVARPFRTAGPDAIRSLAPKQIYALEWRITLDGFLQAPGSTGSPSRHHRPPHPSAVATADGVPSASGCATWDCCRPAIGFSTHEQSPYDPRHFVKRFKSLNSCLCGNDAKCVREGQGGTFHTACTHLGRSRQSSWRQPRVMSSGTGSLAAQEITFNNK